MAFRSSQKYREDKSSKKYRDLSLKKQYAQTAHYSCSDGDKIGALILGLSKKEFKDLKSLFENFEQADRIYKENDD